MSDSSPAPRFSDWGHHVLCVDNDEKSPKMLKQLTCRSTRTAWTNWSPATWQGRPPAVHHLHRGRHQFAEVIFIAVGTPPGYRGAANMSYVEQVGRQVAECMTAYRLLVEKSTVPVNTGEQLKRTVSKYLRADIPFDVASNPEFLKEGTAIEDAYARTASWSAWKANARPSCCATSTSRSSKKPAAPSWS
jgi:UDPglucose 6-dehydrogenase